MTTVQPNRLPSLLRRMAGGFRQALPFLGLILTLAGMDAAAAPATAEEWFKQADDQYQEGEVDQAIQSLDQALKLKADYVEALVKLGDMHVENGDFAKAVDPYKRANQLKPGDYSILLNYSNALEGAGRSEDQLPVLKALFNLNRSDLVTGIKYLTLIEAAGREKYVEEYISLLEELRKAPNADPNYTAKLARAYNKTGKSDKAIATFKELLAKNPESGEYWSGLAAAQAKVDQAAARESFKKAILYTDKADERAKLEKALASLGSAPSAPAASAAPAAPAAPVAAVTAPAAPASDNKAKDEAARLAKAAADQKAKEAADEKARVEAEKKAAALAEKQAKDEAARLAKEDADRKAKEAAEAKAAAEAEKKAQAEAAALAKAAAEAEKKAQADAEKQAREEAARLAKAAADQKAKDAADEKARVEAEKKAAALAEKQAKDEAARLAKEEADRKAKEAAQAKAVAEAEKKAQAEADAKAKAEAARLAKEEADRKAKEAADAKAMAEAEKKARAEAERLAKEEAARLAKEEADRKAKARNDSLAQVAVEKKAAAEAAKLAKEEAARLAKQEADRRAKERADSLARVAEEKRLAAEASKKAKEEAARLAKEEADRKAKEAADEKARVEAERKAAAEAARLAKLEADRLAKEEAGRRAKERADSLARVAEEKRLAAEAAKKAKEEAARLAKEEADRRAKERADSLARVAEEKRLAAEAAKKAKEEAARLAKEEADRRAKERADSLARVAEEKRLAAEAAKKAKEEAARLAKEEADRKAKEAAEERARVEAEKKAAAEAARLAKLEAEKLAKEEADRRAKERADSLARVAEEKRLAAEAAKKAKEEAARLAKEEADRRAKERADSLARVAEEKRLAAEAAKKAKEEAARLAKEEADRRAKERADSLARVAEEKRLAAEAAKKAKEEAARLAKEEADRKAKEAAEERARIEAEKKAAAEAARLAKLEAERLAKEEAARLAKLRADSLARAEEERKARLEAERKAKEEAARLAREEAERKAKEEAERLAREEAERKARAEEERKFQEQVSALLSRQGGKLDTNALLIKIQEHRAASKVVDPRLVEAEAAIHFAQWNFRLVADNLRKLKTLTPSAERMLAVSHHELQEYGEALKHFEKYPGVQSDRQDWGRYIKTLLETRNRPKAIAEYEAYLARYPDADDALAFLIDAYRQPLQKEKLVPKLELQLAKNPKDPALLGELIRLHDKNHPKAIEYRERYLKVSPEDSREALAQAQAYESRGNLPQALVLYRKLAKDNPGDKDLNLKTAELLVQNKQVDEAVALFEAAHTADPADKKLTLRLAALYEETRKTDKAIDAYTQAMETDPKDKSVQQKLLQLLTAKGDKERIRAHLARIEEVDPAAHAAQFQLARMFLADGDKARAYDYLSKALKNQPGNAEYAALLPQVVSNDDQVEQNFALLEKSASQPGAKPELQLAVARGYLKRKNPAQAARLYAEVYAKSPKLLEGNRDAVIALHEARNYELSGALAEKYAAAEPSDKTVREIEVNAFLATKKPADKLREAIRGLVKADPEAGAKWLMKLAELDLEAKDASAAATHAREWLNRNPGDAAGWKFLLPLVAGKPGQEDVHIQALQKLVQLDAANKARYETDLASLQFAKGDYEASEKSLASAVKSAPGNAALWFKLGETQVKLRKEKEAADKFQRAYQIDSKNVAYARAYGASVDSKEGLKANLELFKLLGQNGATMDEKKKLARAYFLNGDYAASAREWDGLVRSEPSLGASEPMVSEAFMKSGQTAKARGLFEERLKSDPSNLSVLETVAEIYKAENNQKGYVGTVEKIVAVDPKHKGYQLVLAVEKEKAGDRKGALEHYGQWVSRNGGDETALKAMHRIAQAEKDTAALIEALTRLNRDPKADMQYRTQSAEIDYKRSGNLAGVEALVKKYPDYRTGKSILVREYIRRNEKQKLLPLEGFLILESKSDRSLLEPLADLYAAQNKKPQAGAAYLELLKANPKDRAIYEKVRKHAAANDSPFEGEILRIGYESFPDDMDTKKAYAASLGKTAKALEVYKEILAKESDVKVLARATETAMSLGQANTAAQFLEKWVSVEPKNPKVWEQALAVHTQLGLKPKMTEDLEQLVRVYPERKDLVLQLARLQEEGGQKDKAVDMYRKGLALDPKNKAVQLKLISLLSAANRKEELRETLLKIDQADPAAHEAQYQLARLYLQDGEKDKAYAYLGKALRNQPANAEYQALLPQVVTSDDQVTTHFAALEKPALMPGAKPELQVLVARGYARKKNTPAAARLYAEAYAKEPKLLEGDRDAVEALYQAKNFEVAGALAEKYLAADGKDRGVREIQVNSYLATRKPADKLREAIKGLIAVDPDGEKWLMKLAELDLAAKDEAAAIAHARDYLDKNPKDVGGWKFLLPLVSKKPGQEETYVLALEKLVQLDPASRARYQVELGGLYFAKGNYEDAEKALAEAVKGSPANAALWFRLGETQVKLRKEKEASAKFQRAYQLEPGNAAYARAYAAGIDSKDEIKANLALFKFLSQNSPSVSERKLLAQSLYLNGDFAGAAREFDWLVKSDAGAAADPMVADAYMKSGQTAKARGLYEERLKQDPDNLQLLEAVAAIHRQEGNQKGYLETVERIVAADPKYKGYQLVLAVEKEKAGDRKGALVQYGQWVSRNGGDATALMAMHRLAESERDTAQLTEALVRINRDPKAETRFKFQLAEIDYKRSGALAGIEALVKKHPDYKRGKAILVKEYIRTNNRAKLIPLEGFLVSEAKSDKNLLEPLADLYAMQGKKLQANATYLELIRANPKDRGIYDKARKYSAEHESPYMGEVLRLGYEGYPEDLELKRAYALSLGKTSKALEVYKEILAKESDVKVLGRAVEIAVGLQQTATAAQLLEKWIEAEPKNPKVWEQALAVHTQLGNKPKMIEDLEQLTRLYPERKELVLQLGRLYEENRQADKAAEMYKRALALEPKNKAVQLKLISLLGAANRKEELREVLLKIEQADPAAHEAQFKLAQIYLAETDKDRAYAFLGKALRNQPANPEYLGLLPLVVTSDDQVMTHFAALERPALMPGAKPELQALVARGYAKKKNMLLASRLFTEVHSKAPRLLEGNRDAILALYEAKNYELAGTLAEKYLAQNGQDKAVREIQVSAYTNTNKPPEKLREALRGLAAVDPEAHKHRMRLAMLDVAVRDTAAAIGDARQWLDRNPKDMGGWRFLLPLVKGRPGYEDAHIKTLEQLVQLDAANQARYQLELGGLYFDKGDYEGAEKALAGATKGSPGNAALWYRLGETQVKLRKEKEAEDKFRRAAQLDPTNLVYARAASRAVNTKDEIKASLALFKFLAQNGPSVDERKKLAQSYYLNNDFANAAREFDWLLKGDPSLGASEPMISDSYMKTGQTAKARGLYEQRLVSDPNNLAVLETVAGIYKQEGNAQGYLKSIRKIVEVDPKHKGYQLILAVELEKAKDYKGALDQYDAWVVRNPDDETALKAMHRLADAEKDTTSLMEALVRLNRQKKVEPQYKFQLAELDYVRTGNIQGIEALVKKNPDYRRGKVILVKAYYRKGALAKMVPYTAFLAQEAKSDKELSEPLGDLWAFQKKPVKANEAYFDAVRMDKKDRGLFDKAYKYAKETASDFRPALLKQGYESFPDDLGLKYDYAMTQGKSQRALDLFKEILSRDRNNVPALRNAAEIAVILRKADEAPELLQRWASLDAEDARPWTLLVDHYTATRNDSKLADALEKLSGLQPKNADLAYRAAMAHRKVGNKDKALELLTKAVALNGTNPVYQKEFGLMQFAAGNLAKAKAPLLVADKSLKGDEEVNKALYSIYMLGDKNKPLARERARVLYALKPLDKTYAYNLARLESDLKSPAEAVKILEKPTLKDGLDAEMSFVLLDGYFKTGQRDRASSLAPTLMRKFPEESKRSLPLAILFYENKNRMKAKEILETYVRNNQSEEAHYYLGKIFFEEKNWTGAIDNLSRADESRPDALGMLGQAYIQNREPNKAIEAYEAYYKKTKDTKVLVELYNLYKKTNDIEGTKAILERLIAAEPGELDYRVELAELYRRGGDVKKAEVQYESILKKSPAHPASNMNLGMILAGRKNYDRAIRMLEIGLAKYPDSSGAWRSLGDAYRAEKRAASALAAYKKSFKLNPKSTHVAVSKMQLAKELGNEAELPSAYADVMSLDSNNMEAGTALAAIRFEERKYGEAAALYARITSNEAGSKTAWGNYGYCLLEIKRIPEAKKALQRALDLGLKDMKLLTSLARIYKEEGNIEKAEGILTEMTKKDPRNHQAWFWLGQIALDRNQPGVAEDYVKKAQLLSPSNPDYTEALARMSFNKDEFSAAAKLLEAVKGSLSTQGRLMYGECLMRMGRNEAALAEYNAVYAKDPSAPVLAKLAELQLHKGNGKEAIRMIEASEHKDDTTVQFALAKARISTFDQEKARDVLEKLIRANRYHAGYYHYRGMSWYQERNFGKAKKDFDQALKYNPDYMESVFYTGMCLLKEGRTNDAKNYFKELSQHANLAWQAKGFLGLGMAFESEKKWEAAENFLQKSVIADATAEASAALAKVLLKMRKPGDAERHARKALELNPGLPAAVMAMADVLLAQNRKAEALALTKKALQENPSSCELLISSAKINFASGNYETSKSNSTYALSICPDEATPYFYIGAVADKKYNKKEAKDMFKAFRKHGGDEVLVPAEYR